MRTITIDILHEKAMDLLKDLESLKVIRLHSRKDEEHGESEDLVLKYKGKMSRQDLEQVDKQLRDLRNAWE